MSELKYLHKGYANRRLQLLVTVSACALLANAGEFTKASAEEGTSPAVWIELGGQLERTDGNQSPYLPPFVATLANDPFTPPEAIEKAPLYSNGVQAKISLEQKSSDWAFSISLRYGRANNNRLLHQETQPSTHKFIISGPGFYLTQPKNPESKKYLNTSARNNESHLVLDFQAGKDIGLGLFGSESHSMISFGTRFAQFTSKSQTSIAANPDFHFSNKYGNYPSIHIVNPQQKWHLYNGEGSFTRSFTGVGPLLAWDSSSMVFGSSQNASITFDWGVNASLLFGRQKAKGHHRTSAFYRSVGHYSGPLPTAYAPRTGNPSRVRTVTVPNVGGFGGISFRYPNAKISLGYRGDFFFNAMDNGTDSRKTGSVGLYGPFASVSIGFP